MIQFNKKIIIGFLLMVSLFLTIDLVTDYLSGCTGFWHIVSEAIVASISMFGAIWISTCGVRLLDTKVHLENKIQAKIDKIKSLEAKQNQLAEGIGVMIESKFDEWQLTASEKEIGLLLLKGLSLKEVADLRGTSESTVRQQSVKIYEKSGVKGRVELSAYFMEDFLQPL